MINRMRSFLGILFLLAFLFPTVVKEVHLVNHEAKFHCDANGSKHIHAQYHDCSLCDFVLPVSTSPSQQQTCFSRQQFAEYDFKNLVEVYFSSSHFSSAQLRAPPVC